MKKRLLSMTLALVMVLGLFPAVTPPARAAAPSADAVTVFDAVGIKTDAPDHYDPNPEMKDTPFGKKFSTAAEVDELLILKQTYSPSKSDDHPFARELYGDGYFTRNPGEAVGNEFLGTKRSGDSLSLEYAYPFDYAGNVSYPQRFSEDSVVMVEANLDIRNNGMKKNAVVFGISTDQVMLGTVKDPTKFEDGQLHPEWIGPDGKPVVENWGVNPIFAYTARPGNSIDKSGANSFIPGRAQKYTRVAAGDFDGDGLDEIAVYIPENPRVDIYKMEGRTYGQFPKFDLAWSYMVERTSSEIPDMVSLVADDYNRDGIDDLAFSYGNPRWDQEGMKSRAVVMMGADQGKMMTERIEFPLTYGEQNIERASFTSGDIDGDGYNELVLGGNLENEPADNRFVAVYKWTGVGFSRMSAENFDLFEKDEDGKRVHANIADKNKYTSLPWMPANIAVGKFYGMTENPCIYIDGIILQNTSKGLTIMDLVPQVESPTLEWGVRTIDGVGNGYDLLISNYWGTSLSDGGLLKRAYKDVKSIGAEQTPVSREMTVVLNRCGPEKVESKSTWTAENTGKQQNVLFCLPNVDHDTVIQEYTGEHYYTYSDPEVLAVLASPPYYNDLDNEEGGGMMESATEYTAIQGSGDGTSRHGGFSAGVYMSYEYEAKILGVSIAKVEAEVELQNSFTWETQKMDTVEYETTYGTLAGQDTVALYSVPTEVYGYKTYIPNPDTGEIEVSDMTVNISHEPTIQTIPLAQYQDIRNDYQDILPEIGKNLLSHEIGVPDSYPSSEMELPSGRKNTIVSPGDPARLPTDGISYQSRAINMSHEEENSFDWTFSLDFKAGGGAGNIVAGVTAGMNAGSGSMHMSTAGHSYSAQVMSAPAAAGPCGYGFNWRLAAFQSRTGFPVVTYLVTDVTNPPLLPSNFRANEELTTTDQLALEWEFKGPMSRFELYRWQKSASGSGYYKIADVTAKNATGTGTDEGSTYRYIDTNVRPNTEYIYRIRTVGITMPNLSIMSDPMTTYSKPDTDIPILAVNNKQVFSYPDEPLYLKTTITNQAELPAGATYHYQWQKQDENQRWVEIKEATANTYVVNEPAREDGGVYRCKVNAMISDNLVTAFTEPITVIFDRRSSVMELAVDQAGMKVDVVVQGDWNVTSIPNGNAELILKGDRDYQFQLPLNSQGRASFDLSGVDDGAYALFANYGGSRVFKACKTNDEFPTFFLKNVPDGETYLEVKESYTYGDPLHIRLHTLNSEGDSVSYEELGTPGHPFNLAQFKIKQNGEYISIRNWVNEIGLYKTYYDRLRSGVAGMAGDFMYEGQPFTIQPFKTEVTGLKSKYEQKVLNEEEMVKWLQDEIRDSGVIKMATPKGMEDDARELRKTRISDARIGALWIKDQLGNPRDLINPDFYRDVGVGEYQIYYRTSSPEGVMSLLDNYDITWSKPATLYITQRTPGVTINVTPPEGGTAQITYPENADRIPVGQRVTVKATPNPGYTVKRISGGDTPATQVGEDTYVFTQAAEGTTINVEFFIQDYKLEVISLPQYPTTNNEPVTNEITAEGYEPGGSYIAGTEFTFKQQAAPGWHFKSWEYRHGKDIVNSMEPEFKLVMPAEDVTLYGKFAREGYQLELGPNLEAYAGSTRIKDLSSIPDGSHVTVKIAPNYVKSAGAVWTMNGEPQAETGDQFSFTMRADTTITLEVEQVKWPVSVDIRYIGDGSSENKVTMSPVGAQPAGTAVTFQAEPGENYDFIRWEDARGDVISRENPCTVVVEGETKLYAVLQEKEYSTITLAAGLMYKVNRDSEYQIIEPPSDFDLILRARKRSDYYDSNQGAPVLYEQVKLWPGDTITIKVADGLGEHGYIVYKDQDGQEQYIDSKTAYSWTFEEGQKPQQLKFDRDELQDDGYGTMEPVPIEIIKKNNEAENGPLYSIMPYTFGKSEIINMEFNGEPYGLQVDHWIINGVTCFEGQTSASFPCYTDRIEIDVVTKPAVWHKIVLRDGPLGVIASDSRNPTENGTGREYNSPPERIFWVLEGEDFTWQVSNPERGGDPLTGVYLVSGGENADDLYIEGRQVTDGLEREFLISGKNVRGDLVFDVEKGYSVEDSSWSKEKGGFEINFNTSNNGLLEMYGRSKINGVVSNRIVAGNTLGIDFSQPVDIYKNLGDAMYLVTKPDPGYETQYVQLDIQQDGFENEEYQTVRYSDNRVLYFLHESRNDLTPVFVPTTKTAHQIQKGTTGAHGSFTIDRGEEIQGEHIAMSYQVDEGYRLDKVTITGLTSGQTVEANTILSGYVFFVMPDEEVRVDMTFTKEGQQYVFAGYGGGGEVVRVEPAGFGEAEPGETVTVRPVARPGMKLTQLRARVNTVGTGDGWTYLDTIPVTDNKDGTYSFTMPERYSVIVDPDFMNLDKVHEIRQGKEQNGTFECSAFSFGGEGQTITVKTAPDQGMETGAVVVTTASGKNVEVVAVPGAENTYSFVMPAEDITVDVRFGTTTSLKGTISVLDGRRDVTLRLYQDGALLRTETIPGVEAYGPRMIDMVLDKVLSGTYDLAIEQESCLTTTITGIVIDGEVDLNSHSDPRLQTIELLPGDVNGDGTINDQDAETIRMYYNMKFSYPFTDQGEEIVIPPNTDLDGDKKINIEDLNLVYNDAQYNKSTADTTISY